MQDVLKAQRSHYSYIVVVCRQLSGSRRLLAVIRTPYSSKPCLEGRSDVRQCPLPACGDGLRALRSSPFVHRRSTSLFSVFLHMFAFATVCCDHSQVVLRSRALK